MPVKLMAPSGMEIRGTLERLSGTARVLHVTREDDGTVAIAYEGYTDIDWDDQSTVTRPNATGVQQLVYLDQAGEEWLEDQLVPIPDEDEVDQENEEEGEGADA